MKDRSDPTNHIADKALDDLDLHPLDEETEDDEAKDYVLAVDGENQNDEDIYVEMLESIGIAEFDVKADSNSELIAEREDNKRVDWEMNEPTEAYEDISEYISEESNSFQSDSEDTLNFTDAFIESDPEDTLDFADAVRSSQLPLSKTKFDVEKSGSESENLKKTADINIHSVREMLDDLASLEQERLKQPIRFKTTGSYTRPVFSSKKPSKDPKQYERSSDSESIFETDSAAENPEILPFDSERIDELNEESAKTATTNKIDADAARFGSETKNRNRITASFKICDVKELLDDLDSLEKKRLKTPVKFKTTGSYRKPLFTPLSETDAPLSETEVPLSETVALQTEPEVPLSETEVPQTETDVPLSETVAPQASAEEMSDIKRVLIELNLLEGTELLKRGDRMCATLYFREAVKLDPTDPNLYLRLVEALGYDKEAIPEVEALLVKASELAPENKKIKSMLLYMKERKENVNNRVTQQDLKIQRQSQSSNDLKVPSVPESETGTSEAGANAPDAKTPKPKSKPKSKFKPKSKSSSVQAAPIFLLETEPLLLPSSINIRNKAIIGVFLILSVLGAILAMRNQPIEKGEVKLLYPSKDAIVAENLLSLKWQASADLFVIQITENDQKIIERATTGAKYDFTFEERALLKPGHTYTWTILPKNINAEDLPYKIEAFQFTVVSSPQAQPSP